MPAGTGISYTTLVTNNGFTAGTAGQGYSGGTNYTKTVGGMTVQVTLYTEPEPALGGVAPSNSTTYSGVVYVLINGDTSASDASSVAALLRAIGITNFATWPNSNVMFRGTNLNGAVVAYSQSF
jgi:hypothetical protein